MIFNPRTGCASTRLDHGDMNQNGQSGTASLPTRVNSPQRGWNRLSVRFFRLFLIRLFLIGTVLAQARTGPTARSWSTGLHWRGPGAAAQSRCDSTHGFQQAKLWSHEPVHNPVRPWSDVGPCRACKARSGGPKLKVLAAACRLRDWSGSARLAEISKFPSRMNHCDGF